jgi:alkylation response protein AidB-like acyl-CoA dehydrogenase
MSAPTAEELESIRSSARSFARERTPVAHLRALRDARDERGYSSDVWRGIAELGLAGAFVPEAWGGAGLGCAVSGILAEELGRNLAPTPLISSVLAGSMIELGGSDALRARVLPAFCRGEHVVALAHDEGTRFAAFDVATRAEPDPRGFVLRGQKSFVVDGHRADAFVVVARTSGERGERDGVTAFFVPAGAPGLRTERMDLVDSRNVARVHLDGVAVDEGAMVGGVGQGAAVLEKALDRGTAVLAAETLGGMQAAFDRTLDYLKTRKQFGVPIGSFQALKHRAAWMFCEIELTRSLVAEALRAVDEGRADASALVSAAKARASDTYILVTNEAVQMHGGVGVTDELDVGLYLKRARVAEHTLGNASYHRDRFARLRGF